ncbi:metal ABC transporter substrate-binding protein [Ruminococcaceae bacterium OttesenSCG-928-L11]|nr:metal ABC transporter substrate-binding protein [Ruminococcaceae bacterium OttesenSCG-928-L11]
MTGKRMKHLVYIVALALIGLLAGCGPAKGPISPDNGKLTVIATNFPGYDFVRQVAGDRVNLTMLLPPGSESHSYEPTPQDMIRVQECDVFICVGGESETWVQGILESVDTSGMRVLAMMDIVDVVEEQLVEGMEHDHDHPEEHDHAAEAHEHEAEYDEHVWTSPRNAMAISAVISATLAELDGDNADTYRSACDTYRIQLERLDTDIRQVVAAGSRNVLVFGDRFPFRYFVDAYGLDYFAAFPGCSAETEASAKTLAFLIDKVKAEEIPTVLHIEFSNEKMADTICEATGAEKLLFHSCHNVTKAQLEEGVTYLSLMEQNVQALEQALA